jgi:uncharacterized protein
MAGSSIYATETHVSWLIFIGDRVYKVKKPAGFAFCDLTTRQERLRACRAEVDLNRRLSPDVYLGVGSFAQPDRDPEPVVVMRRLDPYRSLTALIRSGSPELISCLDEVARVMAAFHVGARRGSDVDRDCTPEAIDRLWRRNVEELQAAASHLLSAEDIAEVEKLGARYIRGRQELFASRIDQRRAVDGHGDLLADDVFCLADGPRLLDCLEFDDSLRHVDTLLDMASLASDLERLGRPDLAHRLSQTYRAVSGDSWPTSLEHFYIAHRALVRGKVACLGGHADQQQYDPAAVGLLAQARRHLLSGTVRLVLIGGLPGTGKSTLAAALSEATGWTLLRSDVVRREVLTDDLAATARRAPYQTGLYQPEYTGAVYSEMLSRAAAQLRNGRSVILDASWSREPWREAAAQTALQSETPLISLCCKAPRAVVDDRLATRASLGHDPSDATAAIAHHMADIFAPWPEAIPIDTTSAPDAVLEAVLNRLPGHNSR